MIATLDRSLVRAPHTAEGDFGAGATIGAGSTITRDAPPDRLTLERSKQTTIESWQRPVKKPRG